MLPGCCLDSFRLLCDIHFIHSVGAKQQFVGKKSVMPQLKKYSILIKYDRNDLYVFGVHVNGPCGAWEMLPPYCRVSIQPERHAIIQKCILKSAAFIFLSKMGDFLFFPLLSFSSSSRPYSSYDIWEKGAESRKCSRKLNRIVPGNSSDFQCCCNDIFESNALVRWNMRPKKEICCYEKSVWRIDSHCFRLSAREYGKTVDFKSDKTSKVLSNSHWYGFPVKLVQTPTKCANWGIRV